MSRIYVASSWRNPYHPGVVRLLRRLEHEVYDFRNPWPGQQGFAWRELGEDWDSWSPAEYRKMLKHPIAVAAFNADFNAMKWADTCLLVLPAGRSASWELGWSEGAGKRCVVYMPIKMEPELMYGGAGQALILVDESELIGAFQQVPAE